MSRQSDKTTELKVGDYVYVEVAWADVALFGRVQSIEDGVFLFEDFSTDTLYKSPIDGDWYSATERYDG